MSFRWCNKNEGGKCLECSCSIYGHGYAKVEYSTKQTESVAYKALKEQITIAEVKASGKEATVN
jgi:hypothetical protein